MTPPRAEGLRPLRTPRLSLRPVDPADLDLLIDLNADPLVMAAVGKPPRTASETRSEWDQRLGRQSAPDRGRGYWLGFEGPSFVGWWSASWFAQRPDVAGIGYRLVVSGWGRGLGTEGARAMVDQAFGDPEVDRVVASTRLVNHRSRRVLEKLGLRLTSAWSQPAEPTAPRVDIVVGYALRRSDHGVRCPSPTGRASVGRPG